MISLIVGLGNPGHEHIGDRHNVGADLVRMLAAQYKISLKPDKRYPGEVGKIQIPDAGQPSREVHLLIPSTYMNRSGKAVAAMASYFKIPPEQILVCHDELDFSPGDVRLKKNGGHGGHNGLRDIVAALGNRNDFPRVRIGIGHPGDPSRVSDYVLSAPTKSERALIGQGIERALSMIDLVVNGHIDQAMLVLHSQS